MKLEDFINKYGNVSVDEKELKEFLGMSKYFTPVEGEDYWFSSNHTGEILYVTNNFDSYDKRIFKHCEVFKTKEEAEEHVRKQVFLLQMKRDFLDNTSDIYWGDERQRKYRLIYCYDTGKIIITESWRQKVTNLITTNLEWLEDYISKYEKEIKKYYFELELVE